MNQPAVTKDGHRIEVAANVGSAKDAQTAIASGAEGTGLLRTEFLYLQREKAPSEAKAIARAWSLAEAKELAAAALMQETAPRVRSLVRGWQKT